MAYEVPPLPYDYAALEPHIDEQTMTLHHDKHHQAYVDKANDALKGTDHEGKPIEELIANLERSPRASGGGPEQRRGARQPHALLGVDEARRRGRADGELGQAIGSELGGFAAFKEAFEAATARFGSGWAWLVVGRRLADVTRRQSGQPDHGGPDPLLGLDVWEHAYYLDYQNRRPDYIKAWWNTLDWDQGHRALRRRLLTGHLPWSSRPTPGRDGPPRRCQTLPSSTQKKKRITRRGSR